MTNSLYAGKSKRTKMRVPLDVDRESPVYVFTVGRIPLSHWSRYLFRLLTNLTRSCIWHCHLMLLFRMLSRFHFSKNRPHSRPTMQIRVFCYCQLASQLCKSLVIHTFILRSNLKYLFFHGTSLNIRKSELFSLLIYFVLVGNPFIEKPVHILF